MCIPRNLSFFLSTLFCLITMALTGCAPSIRYTRTSNQPRATSSHQKYYKVKPQVRFNNQPVNSQVLSRLQSVVDSYLGTPYRFGGVNRKGIDCSGFVSVVYQEVFKIQLPHSSREMYKYGRKIPLKDATAGDLVYFKNHRIGRIDHVGIYMGNGRFAHASSSYGVIYSDMNDVYYAKRIVAVKRILN